MREHVRSLIIMQVPPILPTEIEYYDYPEDAEIELHSDKNGVETLPCRIDISHNNVVEAVYNKDGETIASSMEELRQLYIEMDVQKVFVIQRHEVKR